MCRVHKPAWGQLTTGASRALQIKAQGDTIIKTRLVLCLLNSSET